jgi:hypothetical protein
MPACWARRPAKRRRCCGSAGEATAAELAAELAKLKTSCELILQRAAIAAYISRIRRALAKGASGEMGRQPSADDTAALEPTAAAAALWLDEYGSTAGARVLAAKVLVLEETCGPVLAPPEVSSLGGLLTPLSRHNS